jgi:hypothetical protein
MTMATKGKITKVNKGAKIASRKDAGAEMIKASQIENSSKDQGFSNVNKIWLAKCKTWDQLFEQVIRDHNVTEDVLATVDEMRAVVTDNDKFGFMYKDGRVFVPTPFALERIATWAFASTTLRTYAEPELVPAGKKKGDVLFERDRGDAETMLKIYENGIRRRDTDKKYLWRLNTADNTLRVMLSDSYKILDNRWFLETLKDKLPGAMASHWRGDEDTIYGNLLLPDKLIKDDDGEYSYMLSVGNSEIGQRRLSTQPASFTWICMNGCIWNMEKGEGINYRHIGEVDYIKLRAEIYENIDKQIPLVETIIEKLLGTKKFGWDGVSVKPVVAAMSERFSVFDKKAATETLKAYGEEIRESAHPNTLYSLVGAMTRASQKLPPSRWVDMDTLAGDIVKRWDQDDLDNVVSRAKKMSVKDVDKMFVGVN